MPTSGHFSTSAPRRSSSALNTSSSRISGTAIRLPFRFQSIIGDAQYHRRRARGGHRGASENLHCFAQRDAPHRHVSLHARPVGLSPAENVGLEPLARGLLCTASQPTPRIRGRPRTTERTVEDMTMQARSLGGREGRGLLPASMALVVAMTLAGQTRAEGSDSLKAAFTDVKYILDARLRTEDVDQDPIANEASATTLRLRLGLETAKAWNTVLLVEGEAV